MEATFANVPLGPKEIHIQAVEHSTNANHSHVDLTQSALMMEALTGANAHKAFREILSNSVLVG